MIKTRAVVYSPFGDVRGPLILPQEYTFSSTFCETPAMTLKYRKNDVGWASVSSPCEVAVEYTRDGQNWTELPNGRYLRIARSAQLVGQDTAQSYVLPGMAFLLTKARQLTTTGLNADGKRMFNSSNAGQIVRTLVNENIARGGSLKGISMDFTSSLDSSGVAWSKVVSIGYEPGLDLFTILNNLSLQGVCDWQFQGRTLRLFNADTTLGQQKNVVFQRGRDIGEVPFDGTIEDMVHSLLVLGDANKRLSLSNPTAPEYWGKWEGFVGQGGISDTGTMTILGNAALEDGVREAVQYTAKLNLVKTIYDPFYDYAPGDYVYMPNELQQQQSFRVRGINYGRDGQGVPRIDLVINDRFVEKSIRNARRTNGITGGASSGGSGTKPTVDPGKRVPATPTGLVINSEAYLDSAGYPLANIQGSYNAVTTDVNSVDLEVASYEFQLKKNGENDSKYISIGRSTGTTFSWSPLTTNTAYIVRMRAVSVGGTPSQWSTAVSVTTANDTTAPPKPSTPTATTRLGTVSVTWNGLDSAGATYVKDLERMELWEATAGKIANVYANVPFNYAQVTIGTAYQYYLKAYDRSGNVSPNSEPVSVTVTGIMSDPQAALDIQNGVNVAASGNSNTYSASDPSGNGGKVGDRWFKLSSNVVVGQWRWDGSAWIAETIESAVIANLDAGKITTGTLLAARIASGTITADKLSAGAIDGKVITGATVQTSATGARVLLDSGGLKAYNSSGTLTVSISSSTGALTVNSGVITGATFQTAASGARMLIETNGRLRIFRADATTAIDLNPTLASYNISVDGGIIADTMRVTASTGLSTNQVQNDSGLRLNIYGGASRIVLDTFSGTSRFIAEAAYDRVFPSNQSDVWQLFVIGNGTIARLNTSARKYKLDIQEKPVDKSILAMRESDWLDKRVFEAYADWIERGSDPNEEGFAEMTWDRAHGTVADDWEAAGLERFVIHENGEVEGFKYDRAWLPLLPIADEHEREIQELKRELAELKEMMVK